MDFKVGDVVMLKSGGPKMTVAAMKHDRVFCIWFNQRDQYHEEKTAEFLVATLKSLTVQAPPHVRVGEAVARVDTSTERIERVPGQD